MSTTWPWRPHIDPFSHAVRDGFEVSKPDLEKQISDLTGEAWTIDIEPKNIAPYLAGTGYEGRVGDVIKG